MALRSRPPPPTEPQKVITRLKETYFDPAVLKEKLDSFVTWSGKKTSMRFARGTVVD